MIVSADGSMERIAGFVTRAAGGAAPSLPVNHLGDDNVGQMRGRRADWNHARHPSVFSLAPPDAAWPGQRHINIHQAPFL